MVSKREFMTVQKWYGQSIPIPRAGTKGFVPFLVSGLGIVRSIVQEHLGKSINVRFRDVPTAWADWDKNEIAINQMYLEGRILPEGKALSSDDTIAVILGIIVHESAHFAYSPRDLKPCAEHIKKYSKCYYDRTVATTLGNIIEDIFIEAEVDRRVPTLTWMLDAVNRVFFSKRVESEMVENARPVLSAPTKLNDVGLVLSALILAKTREESHVNPYVDDLFYTVRGATEARKSEDRLALALKVYDKLMCNIFAGMCGKPEKGEGEDEGEGASASGDGEGESGEGEGKGEDALEKAAKQAKGLTSSTSAKKPDSGSVETTTAYEVHEVMRRLENAVVKLDREGVEGKSTVFVEMTPDLSRAIEADQRYEKLSEVARQRASVNRPYGQDRNRGTNIRKLYRIATDQKIFAESVAMSSYKPMQVIVLLDCSGSMYRSIEDAAQAALGAAKGLADARCDVAVYGHTACRTMLNEVVLYRGKEFNEPVTVLPGRLGGLTEPYVLRENKDGHAIRYVTKKFTATSKRRLLIVISDGAPQAPDYSGWEANNHTKKAVEDARQKGIDVLSISITESARRINEYIYGSDNNVFNTDPNVIEGVVRSLIVK